MENTHNNPIIITRSLRAPLEKVWAAWSVPEEVKRWWGPQGFSCPVAEIDFREGGKYLLDMQGGEAMKEFAGRDIYSTGTYKEIIPMKKIVVSDSFSDEQGNIVPSSHYGMEGMPMATEISITFADNGAGDTTMTITHEGIPDTMRDDCVAGWNSSFDKLEASLT